MKNKINLSGNKALKIFCFAYKNTFVTLFSKNGILNIVEFNWELENDSLANWVVLKSLFLFKYIECVEVKFSWDSNQYILFSHNCKFESNDEIIFVDILFDWICDEDDDNDDDWNFEEIIKSELVFSNSS